MRLGKATILIALVLSLGLMLHSTASSVPPAYRAVGFLLAKMMDSQGGVYTQYLGYANPREGEAAGHDILLQNTSLLMRYAVEMEDRELFDQQVKLVRDYFLEESVGLLYWKLDQHLRPVQSTWKTYSNDPGASLRVVEALLSASELWREKSYWDLAFEIGDGLKNHNLAPDQTLRYYASWTPTHTPAGFGDRVVLAQLAFNGMAGLAWWDRPWATILTTNIAIVLAGMTNQGLFYQSYLPVKERYDKGDGSMLQMAQTAYQLAAYGKHHGVAAAIATARKFLSFAQTEYVAKSKIFARYDPETGVALVTWENISVYALIAQTALVLGDSAFAERIIAQKILPTQQSDLQSPVYGAFSTSSRDAYAFDTLEALLALPESKSLAVSQDQQSIRAVWYLSWKKDSYMERNVAADLWEIQSRLCPNYIGLFAATYQDDKASSDPHRDPERTPSDESLRRVIGQIHRMGMGVILLTPLFPDDGSWEGVITPKSVEQWFANWREILLHYAKLAEENRVEVLLLGSELVSLRDRTRDWNRLIGAIRRIYHGKLSYSANFWADRDEYQQVGRMTQWRQLDYIGVTAYFELTNKAAPSRDELIAAWRNDRNGQDVLADLAALNHEYGKPIVFWEIGYFSRDKTNAFPWNYPQLGGVDEGEQADCWTAFLDVFKGIDWFTGYGIYAEQVGLPTNPMGYDVLGKPAEAVLRRDCGE